MSEITDGSMLRAYFKAGAVRISRTNIMRDDAIKGILKVYLRAGDEALAEGSMQKAERFYHEIVKLAAKELLDGAPETALAKFNLSMLYLDRGQTTEAAAFAQAAVDMFVDLFGHDHPSTGMALHQLAEVQQARREKESKHTKAKAQKVLEMHYRRYQRYFDARSSRELKEASQQIRPSSNDVDALEQWITGSMFTSLN
jgi:tetratricopeptide (TPR) repeat protein